MKRNQKNKTDKIQASLQKTSTVSSKRGFRTLLRRNLYAVGTLIFGMLICCTSIITIFLSLNAINVAKTLRVQGHIQAIEQSTPISHRRGGVISQVFVTEGEVVREGQILASLNTQELTDELKVVRQTVAGLILRSQCLRALRDDKDKFVLNETLKQVMGRLQQVVEMKRSTLRCQETLDIRKLELATTVNTLRSEGDIVKLSERISETNILMFKKLGELENKSDEIHFDEIKNLVNLRKMLNQTIESVEAKQVHTIGQSSFTTSEIQRKSKIDVELEVMSDRLVEAQAELSGMEMLLNDKFIYASTSGRVQRMRIENEGQRIAAGAYVLEISPLITDFEVSSRVNFAEFPSLEIGHLVQVKLSGGLPKPIWVPGRIDNISKISENKRLLSIRLKREDLNKRDLLLGDHSLNGLGERSDAIISITSESALETLETSLKRIFRFNGKSIQMNI